MCHVWRVWVCPVCEVWVHKFDPAPNHTLTYLHAPPPTPTYPPHPTLPPTPHTPSQLTKSIIRPRLEPINSAAVDERGKLAQTIAECVPNGTESKDDMEVFFAAIDKKVEEREWGVFSIFVLSLCQRTHCLGMEGTSDTHSQHTHPSPPHTHLYDFLLLIQSEEVCYLSCIQQTIHVLKKAFLFDLCVCQQKHCRIAIFACTLQHGLQQRSNSLTL